MRRRPSWAQSMSVPSFATPRNRTSPSVDTEKIPPSASTIMPPSALWAVAFVSPSQIIVAGHFQFR